MTAKDETLEPEAHTRMVQARAALVLDHPFFGSLALRLALKADLYCSNLWSDGRTLGYNPLYVTTLSKEKLIAAQAHELLHLACKHHIRRKGRDATLWNEACDYAVNQILSDSGFTLPEGALHNIMFRDMSVDAIYDYLATLPEREANAGADNARTAGDGGNGDGSPGENHDAGQETMSNNKSPSSEGEEENQETKSSLQAIGQQQSSESPKQTKDEQRSVHFFGEIRDHPAISDQNDTNGEEKASIEADIALNHALQSAKGMGNVPIGLERAIRDQKSSSLDWHAILRRFIEQNATNDYSWLRPNLRYLHQDIYLPSRKDQQIESIVFAIDSSGSIDESALGKFCAELSAVLEAYDATITVIFHDTKIYAPQTITRHDLPIHLEPVGGGGTDYRPVAEFITDNGLTPGCLIWFTDMECSLFPEVPTYPVLWVISGDQSTPPPFGEVICLQEEMAVLH